MCQARSGLAWPDKIHPGLSRESVICFLFELGRGSGARGDKMVVGVFKTKESGTRGTGICGDEDKDVSPTRGYWGPMCGKRDLVSLSLQWHRLSFSWGAILLVP